MRQIAGLVTALVLMGGCEWQPYVFVDPNRTQVEEQHDLAECSARAEQLPLPYPNPKLPPGADRRRQTSDFIADCMTAKGYHSQGWQN